jgi:hypothetical protein
MDTGSSPNRYSFIFEFQSVENMPEAHQETTRPCRKMPTAKAIANLPAPQEREVALHTMQQNSWL